MKPTLDLQESVLCETLAGARDPSVGFARDTIIRLEMSLADFDKPIAGLAGAKAYFRGMGYSHFHMYREYPERYREYEALAVPETQEIEWTKEEFEVLRLQVSSPESDSQILWRIHSRMDDLAQSLKTVASLECIHETTLQIEQRLPARGKLLVAETINGRQYLEYRDGLIFLAYDLGRKDIAESIASLSAKLSQSANKCLESESERCSKALSVTNEIRGILKI